MFLSYIVPAHNSSGFLENTVDRILLEFTYRGIDGEVVIVENGSSDSTYEVAKRIAQKYPQNVQALTSEKGIGAAYKRGILVANGNQIVLTADDIPFLFSDLDNFLKFANFENLVAVGSKSHKESQVTNRTLLRRVMTSAFTLMRRFILGIKTKDTQGTYFMQRALAEEFFPTCKEDGFLFTTELALLIERKAIKIVEVPIIFRGSDQLRQTTIRAKDAFTMLLGIVTIANRLFRQ